MTGCGPKRESEEPICEGKATVAEAIETLRQKQPDVLSMRSAIRCDIKIADAQNKPINENFDGTMIFVGPDNLRMGGSKFGPILIGTNQKEFWFYVKPGFDAAWWGQKKDVPTCADKLGFNPCYLSEALGQIDLDRDWALRQEPGYDILVVSEDGGGKKVYINCCTYQVDRIEYFNINGGLVASADLSDYREVPDVGHVPQSIELRHFRMGQADSVIRLRLSGISRFEPTAAQKKMFERPVPKGYKSIYRWTENCEFVME